MKTSISKRNKIIVGLLVFGLALFGLVEGVVIPQMEQNKQQYIAEQQDPLTHDIENVLQFKNKYMGNAGNLINLFSSLPLNNIEKKYQLYPDTLTAEVNYHAAVAEIGEERVDKALIYNATASFALIDNLEAVNFHFSDATYSATRSDVEEWYGVTLSTLLDKKSWNQIIQDKLNDKEYVRNCKEAILKNN